MKLIKKIKNNKPKIILFILVIFFGIFGFFNISFAQEQIVGTNYIEGTLLKMVGGIAQLIVWICGILLTKIIAVMLSIVSYNNFINEPDIINGWKIVRDLSNMFFILVLLVIAFATILKVESYNAKKLLPKLLLMAILINFSKTILGLLIDFSQVIMLTFVNAFSGTGGEFIVTLKVKEFLSINTNFKGDWTAMKDINATNILGGIFIAIAFMVVSTIAMLAILITFLMRMIMLWIYIVLSPLAFLLSAFPAGAKYASQFWGDLAKYLINGPVLAFFIWLALITAQNFNTDSLKKVNDSCTTEIMCMDNFIGFIIAIGFLVGGLIVSQQIGGIGSSWGANAVKSAGKKGLAPLLGAKKLAGWGLKRAGGLVEQKMEEIGAPMLTRGYWKGFGARGDRLKGEAAMRAMGRGEQLAEERLKPIFWKKREGAMDRAEMQRRAVINQIIGDYGKAMGATADPRQDMQHQATLALEAKGIEGEQRREAIMEMATQKGNLDDVYFSIMPNFRDKVKNGEMTEEEFEKKFYMSTEDSKKYSVNKMRRFTAGYLGVRKEWIEAVEMPEDIAKGSDADKEAWLKKSRDKIETLLESSDAKEQNKLRTMGAISEVAKKVGHWEQLTTVKDDITGKYKLMSEPDRHAEVIGEFRKQPIRNNLSTTATHNSRVSIWNEKEGDYVRSGRKGDQEAPEMRFWEEAMGGGHVRDIHQTQGRYVLHMIGQYFDDTSALVTDDEEAQERGFDNAKDLEESMEYMRVGNKQIFEALYRLKFYGRGDQGEFYKEPGWKPKEVLSRKGNSGEVQGGEGI